MKKSILCGALVMIGAGGLALAGFKVKLVKPKKPDKFQVQVTADRIIYAADLLLEAKEQKKYFYKELASANIVAVRLAVFNQGAGDVVLPLQGIQLLGLDGEEIPLVDPLTVADAILQGRVVSAGISKNPKVAVAPGMRPVDPRMDPSDPRYDPTMDPSRPGYDPRHDPTYDPNDPRNRGVYGGPGYRPGVDVVLNPGGGSKVDLTVHEQALVRKDFEDKAHSTDPIWSQQTKDKFLYFSLSPVPDSPRGFKLRLTSSKGIPQEVVLAF